MKQKLANNDGKRIKALEDMNQKLQRTVNALMQRMSLLERKTSNTAHKARVTENNVRQLQRQVHINEGKVTHVENILGKY